MRRLPYTPIALILALALVALLAWQNRGLREERDWLVERAAYPYHGMYVPTIAVTGLQGEALTLGGVADGFQVLYFFTPQCPYCRDSAPMVRTLADRVGDAFRDRVQMIGVGAAAPDAVAGYVHEHGFGFPVAAVEDRRTVMLFRGDSVPLVLVIGPDGRVLHSHHGTIDSMEQVGAILAAMRTDTPLAAATRTRSIP